ncbi:MAG: hypothetical protein Q9218_003478 [Villophora microphyllina]
MAENTYVGTIVPAAQASGIEATRAVEFHGTPNGYICSQASGIAFAKRIRVFCPVAMRFTELQSCVDDHLVYPPNKTSSGPIITSENDAPACSSIPTRQHLSDPPYENYFYSDCNVAAQVVLTSPIADSNLSIIGPRLIVAWPAGNSGIAAFFAPQNGVNGTLSIQLVNASSQSTLQPYYNSTGGRPPSVGVSGVIRFNASAELTISILGSVRTIRDFTEGPSLLAPVVQDAITYDTLADGGTLINRTWLDNTTTSELGFIPVRSSKASDIQTHVNEAGNTTLRFEQGDYTFFAAIDYPQLTQLNASTVLNQASQDLISQDPDQTMSLSFLSYNEKLLAGAWRFLTYFGRDSMIATLLLQPVLSDKAIEAVIGAVLERINRTDGSVCHEETIGDYATYLNRESNTSSTDPIYDYKMIDSDYYLPILMDRYFLQGTNNTSKAKDFLRTSAGMLNPTNKNLTWGDLALVNAEKIMEIAARFASEGNQTIENLARLKDDQIVGEWRDSTYGIGGGRIPFDVNTALIPAALHAISSLSSSLFSTHPDWPTLASHYAQIWEEKTLPFFSVTVPASEAQKRVDNYTATYLDPISNTNNTSNTTTILSGAAGIEEDIKFYALALDGNNNLSHISVMNSDSCFRLFLLNSSTTESSTPFLNSTAKNILNRFPAGLMTDVGLLVANPAYGAEEVYARNFTRNAYHGTVVWSWVMAMMARGLEQQLTLCNLSIPAPTSIGNDSSVMPGFCKDELVYGNVKRAYNALWDVIEENESHLSNEVWSWNFVSNSTVGKGEGRFTFTPLGALPPPEGQSPTESDIRQLWSLTFLAVTRNEAFR